MIIHLSDSGVILGLEPLDGIGLLDLMGGTDGRGASLTAGNTLTWAGHDAVEVHSVNTNGRIVLDAQVNVLRDTKTKVTSLREVPLPQLILLDLETSLKDLLSLRAADSNMDSNLFVSSDTEGSDGVAGLGVDGGLTRKLLKHFGGTGEPVSGLSDTDIEDELLNPELPHGVGGFGFGHCN